MAVITPSASSSQCQPFNWTAHYPWIRLKEQLNIRVLWSYNKWFKKEQIQPHQYFCIVHTVKHINPAYVYFWVKAELDFAISLGKDGNKQMPYKMWRPVQVWGNQELTTKALVIGGRKMISFHNTKQTRLLLTISRQDDIKLVKVKTGSCKMYFTPRETEDISLITSSWELL